MEDVETCHFTILPLWLFKVRSAYPPEQYVKLAGKIVPPEVPFRVILVEEVTKSVHPELFTTAL